MIDDQQASSVVAASAEDADEPMAPLERRYRRWLGLFPSAYRADREDELVGVLLDTASPGQERPRLAEVVDLAKAAAVAHVRSGRTSASRRAWSDASVIIGLVLALVLAAQGVRFLALIANRAIYAGSYGAPELIAEEVRGWYVPIVWTAVVALLCAGCTRLACAAAWLGAAARLASIVDIATNARFPWSEPGGDLWVAQPIVVQLTMALIAALLLSRPRRVRAMVESIGRARLAAIATTFVVAVSAWRWLARSASGTDMWILVMPLVAVLVIWGGGGRGREIPRGPVARRVLAGLLSLVAVYWASGAFIRPHGLAVITRRDLVATFLVGIATAVVSVLVIALVVGVVRRLPFRVVRRRA